MGATSPCFGTKIGSGNDSSPIELEGTLKRIQIQEEFKADPFALLLLMKLGSDFMSHEKNTRTFWNGANLFAILFF
jgi:hypothetical protein